MRSKNIKLLSMKDPKREMSKQQTPITAKEWLKQRRIDNGNNHNWEAPYINPLTSELMEQYAQAKVLEALEREFTNYENNNPNKGHIEHYETEVKPKYK